MPIVGFGTAGLGPGARDAVRHALQVGYRHIDTAQAREWYREDLVGEGIVASGIPRSDLFITSKLHPRHFGYNSSIIQFELTLQDLGSAYVDLFLLHYANCWGNLCKEEPEGTWKESWRALEQLVRAGKVKAIGRLQPPQSSSSSKMHLDPTTEEGR